MWPRRVERKRAQLALCCTKANVVLAEAVFRTTAPARGHAPRRREAMDDRPLKRVRSWKIICDEALRLAVDDPPSELERTRKELEATRAKLARTEATLKTTEATLQTTEATLALKTKVVDSFLRPQPSRSTSTATSRASCCRTSRTSRPGSRSRRLGKSGAARRRKPRRCPRLSTSAAAVARSALHMRRKGSC